MPVRCFRPVYERLFNKTSNLSYGETIWQLEHYAAPLLTNFTNKICLLLLYHLKADGIYWISQTAPSCGRTDRKIKTWTKLSCNFSAKKTTTCRWFYVWQRIQVILQTILNSSKQGQMLHLKIINSRFPPVWILT